MGHLARFDRFGKWLEEQEGQNCAEPEEDHRRREKRLQERPIVHDHQRRHRQPASGRGDAPDDQKVDETGWRIHVSSSRKAWLPQVVARGFPFVSPL
jgi:hypothetical protein